MTNRIEILPFQWSRTTQQLRIPYILPPQVRATSAGSLFLKVYICLGRRDCGIETFSPVWLHNLSIGCCQPLRNVDCRVFLVKAHGVNFVEKLANFPTKIFAVKFTSASNLFLDPVTQYMESTLHTAAE